MDTEKSKRSRSIGEPSSRTRCFVAAQAPESIRASLPSKFTQQQKIGRNLSSLAKRHSQKSQDGPEVASSQVSPGSDRSTTSSKHTSCQSQVRIFQVSWQHGIRHWTRPF